MWCKYVLLDFLWFQYWYYWKCYYWYQYFWQSSYRYRYQGFKKCGDISIIDKDDNEENVHIDDSEENEDKNKKIE